VQRPPERVDRGGQQKSNSSNAQVHNFFYELSIVNNLLHMHSPFTITPQTDMSPVFVLHQALYAADAMPWFHPKK